MKTIYTIPITVVLSFMFFSPQAQAAELKQLAEQLVNLTVKEVTIPQPNDCKENLSKCIKQIQGVEKTDIRRSMPLFKKLMQQQHEHLNEQLRGIREGGRTVGAGQVMETAQR